jgi:epoxyqueuosine reductase
VQSETLAQTARDAGFSLAAVTGNRFPIENCRSVLAVGLVYGNVFAEDGDRNAAGADSQPETPARIAPFARRNYYRAAVQKLQRIAQKLRGEHGGEKADYRIYCNSSALDEKKIAFASGLADIGRNTLLLTRTYGSLFITGILALPFALEDCATRPPSAAKNPFSLCKKCDPHNPPCHAACPTGALTGEGRIEKERCIQWYLSGHGDTIPAIVKKNWNNRLYGCTRCQDACIYHQKPIRGADCALGPLPAVMDAQKIASLPGAEIKTLFHGTALGLSWLCPDGLKRNAAVCVETQTEQLRQM